MTYYRRGRVHLIEVARPGHGPHAKIRPTDPLKMGLCERLVSTADRSRLDGRDPATAQFAVAAGRQWAGALVIVRTMIDWRARTGTSLREKRDAVKVARPSVKAA